MENEISRSVNYAKKRSQALRNCESHLSDTLWKVAQQIVSASSKYTRDGSISNEASFLSDAKGIASTASKDIESYTGAYAKASCKVLGIGTDNIESLLVGDIYGKTLSERNATYLANFAEDIVRMVKAGVMMGYADQQILNSIRTGYKDPYKASVVTKAQKKDINIATPSYGKGVFRNAYQNIVRNSKQAISIAWSNAEQEYGVANGAVGFKVHRGSSFPCETCDEQTRYVHKPGENPPMYHVACRCFCEFIYNNSK